MSCLKGCWSQQLLNSQTFQDLYVSGSTKGFTLTLVYNTRFYFPYKMYFEWTASLNFPVPWKDFGPPLTPKMVDLPEQLVSWAPYMCSQENFDSLWDRKQTGWNNGFAWIENTKYSKFFSLKYTTVNRKALSKLLGPRFGLRPNGIYYMRIGR